MRISFDDIKPVGVGPDVRITIGVHPGWLARLFGFKPYTATYQGGATVWHKWPGGQRASTMREGQLADFEVRAKYNGYHPFASDS